MRLQKVTTAVDKTAESSSDNLHSYYPIIAGLTLSVGGERRHRTNS